VDEEKEKLLAGCVVLYNPDRSIIKNVESYLNFLNVLYVVDNSDNIDKDLVNDLCLLNANVIYIPQNTNIGVASALNLSARLAIYEKYNWLLTMDQDSYFHRSDFFNKWPGVVMNDKIGLIAASYTTEYDRWQKDYSAEFNEIHFAITSGNVINLKAWNEVRGFEDKLFIDEVDHDYCLKLRKNGYKVLISREIVMGHQIGEFYPGDLNGDTANKKRILHRPVRYYYMSRNVLYLCKKYFFTDFRFVLARFYYLIKNLAKIILMYPDKLIYLRFFFAGIKDFALSKYDKYDRR
jgi:rhamnosyltransferase